MFTFNTKRNNLNITYTFRYLKSVLEKAGWYDNGDLFRKGKYMIGCYGDITGKITDLMLCSDERYIATTVKPLEYTYVNFMRYEHIGVPIEEIIAGATGDIGNIEMRMNNYENRRVIEEL